MRHKISFTKELAELLSKHGTDTYCSENATVLATQLVSVLEDKARTSIYQK